jgi:anti-sigma28 factor (negative regulator of flagellin synthesis)
MEITKMDIKNVEGSRTQAAETLRNRKAPAQTDSGSSAPTNKVADNTTDLSNTARVVGVGRAEAMKLHHAELQQIAQDIESGNYTADLNLVAERVAQILANLK